MIARQFDSQPLHFVAQVAIFQRARDDQQQLAVAEGLGDVVEGAELHRFDRGLNRSERRDDDHRQVGRRPLELGLQSVPAHPGHPQIRNQHVGRFPLDDRERLMPRMRAQRAVSCLAQDVAQRADHVVIVVDDQHGRLLVMHAAVAGLPAHVRPSRWTPSESQPRTASPTARAEGYLAVVLAHYRLADREAHPGALARLLGGEERREETLLVLGRDAGAGVLERDHRARAVALCSSEFAVTRSVPPPRCIASSAFMIMLTNTCSIWSASQFTVSGSIAESRDDLHAAMHRFRLEQGQRPFDDGPQIADRLVRLALARVVEQHPDDSRDPIDLPHDDAQLCARLRRNCLILLQRPRRARESLPSACRSRARVRPPARRWWRGDPRAAARARVPVRADAVRRDRRAPCRVADRACGIPRRAIPLRCPQPRSESFAENFITLADRSASGRET